jgi:nucleotide-binding universal stress UspA family protein
MSDSADVFARVVCGIDASGAGLEALRQTLRLRPAPADLVLLGVSETHLAVHAGIAAPRAAEEIEAAARAALAEAETLGGAPGTIVRGRPDETLLRVARERRATLVAVGSHDHRRGVGIVLGSVATRMLHDAPCSVLVARPPAEPDRFPRAIVAGVDGSPQSCRAARVARELGARLGAPTSLVVARSGPGDVDADAIGASGLDVAYVDARPVPALLEAAQDADLVVLGSRGLRGLRALGSVSERVAHHARCSLVVLRDDVPATAAS